MGRSGQRSRKEGAKKGKASRWKRRPRKTDQQGRWIVDNSTSGKIHRRVLGAPHGKEGKIGWRSLENVGQVDLGFYIPRVLTPRHFSCNV
jgi:hypothetical protein